MRTKSERLIYPVPGTLRSDIHPMALALDIIIDLHFTHNIPRADIKVTKSVYPQVALRLDRSLSAVYHSIERLANLCWDTAKHHRLYEFIGRNLSDIPATSDILFYIAYLLSLFSLFILEDFNNVGQANASVYFG